MNIATILSDIINIYTDQEEKIELGFQLGNKIKDLQTEIDCVSEENDCLHQTNDLQVVKITALEKVVEAAKPYMRRVEKELIKNGMIPKAGILVYKKALTELDKGSAADSEIECGAGNADSTAHESDKQCESATPHPNKCNVCGREPDSHVNPAFDNVKPHLRCTSVKKI